MTSKKQPPVSRYSRKGWDGRASGDFLQVGDVDFGSHRDLVDAEFKNRGAGNMRPMFYTGSPFGLEILKLALIARPNMAKEIQAELDKWTTDGGEK